MWTQRDQFSKTKIPLGDYDLISLSPNLPKANHPSSKYLLAQVASSPSITVGYLVYLYCDRNKSRGRDRYLVTSTDGAWCQVRKFAGSQLRGSTFRIRKAEFYKVPMNAPPSLPHHMSSARFDTDDGDDTLLPPASPPQIPTRPQMLYLLAPRHCCSFYTFFSSRLRY